MHHLLERFFRISDVLPKPDPGRPERPQAAARQPAGIDTEAADPEILLPIELPNAPAAASPELSLPESLQRERQND